MFAFRPGQHNSIKRDRLHLLPRLHRPSPIPRTPYLSTVLYLHHYHNDNDTATAGIYSISEIVSTTYHSRPGERQDIRWAAYAGTIDHAGTPAEFDLAYAGLIDHAGPIAPLRICRNAGGYRPEFDLAYARPIVPA